MNHSDERELLRLASLLEALHERPDVGQHCREAIQKAALALSVAFIHGLRAEVEELYATLDKPLPEAARQHLLRLGINPDAQSNR